MSYKTQIEQTLSSLKREKKKLAQKLSQHDLYEQDLLHYIEFEKYDAVIGSKILKKLKENRRGRRLVKDELNKIDCAISALKAYFEKPKRGKKYHYKILKKDEFSCR